MNNHVSEWSTDVFVTLATLQHVTTLLPTNGVILNNVDRKTTALSSSSIETFLRTIRVCLSLVKLKFFFMFKSFVHRNEI